MNTPECNICHIELDEEEHQPLHLGCSHDACRACVKGLINNGSLMCPMCRTVVIANTPDDLKINHGVVQILRMFKEFKMSENNLRKEEVSTKNIEMCRIHKQSLDMRCVSCNLWICLQCKETHTPEMGCEVQDYHDYLKKRKEGHIRMTKPTILSMRLNLKSYSSRISQIEEEISHIECEKKKLEEKHKNILKVVEEGSMTLNEVKIATAEIENASTVMELDQKVNICFELKQFARLWCKKNPGSYLELLKSGEEAYTIMEIDDESFSSKLLLENGNFYLHCSRINDSNLNKSSLVCPYRQVLAWLPPVHDLVFLDLAIAGTVKGRVTIRLRQDLTYYATYFPSLCSGEEGDSLLNLQFRNSRKSHLSLNLSSIKEAMDNWFGRDTNAGHKVVPGSVFAYYSGDTFSELHILSEQSDYSYGNDFEVFGQIESGLDIVKLCCKFNQLAQVTVADCGLVFKEETLCANIGNN